MRGVTEPLQCIAAHSSCSANRSSRIVTGGKVRAAQVACHSSRKSHTCSMGLECSGDRRRPIRCRSISSHSKKAVRQLLCDDMAHCQVHEKELQTHSVSEKDAHMEEESR
ncbi:hypothetical protein TNCV_4895081 [Trichonephila clavipes]|nr:hypothetical protein TNCV_4895081 [Trichonephila clavipes]